MTNDEAITIIKKEFSEYRDTLSVYAKKRKKALDMAIKALEQQQNIITQIEQARDKDKNAGEYPYNRCIRIVEEVMGNDD